jgi:hypothetical protein
VGQSGVFVTTVVLDIGIQGRGTAMQTIIQSLTNEARSRVTAIFIFVLFMGGSAAGSSLYQHFGWTANRFFGIGLILVTGTLHLVARPGWRETKHKRKEAGQETEMVVELETHLGEGSEVWGCHPVFDESYSDPPTVTLQRLKSICTGLSHLRRDTQQF